MVHVSTFLALQLLKLEALLLPTKTHL